jgi:peptidyl-prolyl cis-trans isomerase D
MLQVFRRHSYSWGTRVLLLLLGGVFALFFGSWGAASYFTSLRPAARIGCYTYLHFLTMPGCQTITTDQLDSTTIDLRREIQNVYGEQSQQMLKTLDLRQMALDQLVDQTLINREARRIGLLISDDELAQAIASQTAFKVDGRFNLQKYDEVLRENDMQPSTFESKTRDQMLSETVREMVGQAVQPSQNEVRGAFNLFAENLSLSYVEFPRASFVAQVSPTSQQLVRFYKDNRDQFREPEQIEFQFIRYDPAVLGAKENPSSGDIEVNYERNVKSQFTHPQQVRARHILIAFPPDASPGQRAAAKSRAEEVLQKLKTGGDFAKLVQQYSDDPGTRDKGGELGYFGRGEMVKPFEDAAFKLAPGQVTLVESQYGYHVLQVEEVKRATQDTIEEATPKIIAAIREKVGSDAGAQDVQQDLTAALEGRDLKELAQKRGLVAVQTRYLSASESVSGAESEPKLLAEAFKIDKGDSRAITDTSVPFLVKLIDRVPSQIPPYSQVEAKVQDALINQKAEQLAAAAAETALKQVKEPTDLDSAAALNHLEVRTTGEFSRASGEVPGIGPFPEVIQAAAMVTRVPATLDRVLENKGDSYIFAILSRKSPTDRDWKTQGSVFTQQFLQQRRLAAWGSFINHLKIATPITINADLIGQSSEPSSM